MSVLAIILVASESSDSVMQPHEQDDVVPVLECVRRHCPVRFGGPREIANDPVVVFSMGEEVAAFGDFAECGATWQMVMECAFPPARIYDNGRSAGKCSTTLRVGVDRVVLRSDWLPTTLLAIPIQHEQACESGVRPRPLCLSL